MRDDGLFRFFDDNFGPGQVTEAIVLQKRLDLGENFANKINRYGFVTFKSVETVKKVLAADHSKLTLDGGRKVLTVGPAKRRSFFNDQWQAGGERREARPPVWRRESKLRAEAQDWRGRETDGQLTQSEPSQPEQVHNQPQQCQYQEVPVMFSAPAYYPHYQDQMMVYPTYYDPQYPQYTQSQYSQFPVYTQYPQYPFIFPSYQFQQAQYDQQQQLTQQLQYAGQQDLLQDSGYYDVSNASLVSGEVSQTFHYESKEVTASPVLNLSTVIQQEPGEPRRPGWKVGSPYRTFKPFSGDNSAQGPPDKKSSYRAGRVASTEQGREAKDFNKDLKPTIAMKEIRKGYGKKNMTDKSEILQEPVKKLYI